MEKEKQPQKSKQLQECEAQLKAAFNKYCELMSDKKHGSVAIQIIASCEGFLFCQGVGSLLDLAAINVIAMKENVAYRTVINMSKDMFNADIFLQKN